METVSYQQLLAEQYEENARNLLVFQTEGNTEEDNVESYVEGEYQERYEDYKLDDPEAFNKFHKRHDPSHVIKPDPEDDLNLKRNTKIRKLVLNIDAQFRGNVVPGETLQCVDGNYSLNKIVATSPSEFVFMGSRLYKNVVFIKMTSCEFQNAFYTFSKDRGNTSFTVLNLGTNITYNVNLGLTTGANYATPAALETAINNALTTAGVPGLTITYVSTEHQFRFSGLSCVITFPTTNNNPHENGIGYNLGFLQKSYTIGALAILGAEGAPDLTQDRYIYLDINQWNVIEHQQYGQTYFPVFAKLQLNQPKNSNIFVGNYIDSSSKEYHFQQPTNLQKFHIRILDAYGNPVNMRNTNISLTLEIYEAYDFASYEKVRALV